MVGHLSASIRTLVIYYFDKMEEKEFYKNLQIKVADYVINYMNDIGHYNVDKIIENASLKRY